jgi:5-methylthioadenosine/S-adenosylhomocysteine deaminase
VIASQILSLLFFFFLALASAEDPAATTDADVVIVAGHVLTMDANSTVHSPGAVAVKGTKIVAVGEEAAVRARFRAARTIEARDSVLLPGLVNAHTHAAMTLFRGFTDGLPLETWLTTKIFPAEKAGVTALSVRAGTRLALAEMARSGTTTFCDMYYFEDVVAEETERAGLRAVLGSTVIGFPVPDAPDVAAALERADAFLTRFQDHPLIVPAVAPHSTYTLDAETLQKCRALADEFGAPLLIHLSETRAEVEDVRKRFGETPIGRAESLGLFSSGPTIAAHCVHPTEADIAILARRRVGVAHCPESNMKLGSGVAPIPKLLAKGIAVGLGTDGAASNDDLDLFEEIDSAAKLQKVAALDPTAIDAKTVVRMATIGGARALFLGEKIGSIEVGKEADLVLAGGSREGLSPMGDPWSFVAYVLKGADVSLTMVAGRVVFENGTFPTIDAAGAARDVSQWRKRIEASMAGGDSATSEEEEEKGEARIEIVSKGGFAAFLESRLIASSRGGFIARVNTHRPDDPAAIYWEKWTVDGAAVREIARALDDAGSFAKQGVVRLPKGLVVADAPAEAWRLTIGGETVSVEVEPGAQVVDSFPAPMRAAREALYRLTSGTPTASGRGSPPAEIGAD